MSPIEPRRVSLPETIGGGYGAFWRFRGRYRVVKGGRASKKSCTAALWFIYHLMRQPAANLLVVRRYFNGHEKSTFTQLQWAIDRLSVAHLWRPSRSPLGYTYLPTGQRIVFAGLDDPQSLASITMAHGELCWVWIEEAFQITSEDDFNKLDMSIRGQMPPGCFKQLTLTFNPWSAEHWLKRRFFDTVSDEVLAITTNYLCNEFLDEADRTIFDEMRERFPRRYEVEGLGHWGIAEGLVYENWKVEEFDRRSIIQAHPGAKALFGMDFGYTNDPTAFIALLLDEQAKEIYIFDEHYQSGMVNDDIARMITGKGYAKERVIADSAEPKSIEEIRRAGISRIHAARKGPDSVRAGIQRLQGFQLIVHPDCQNTLMELQNYTWDVSRDGRTLNQPVDNYNHLMDALRYATEGRGGLSVFK